MKNKYCLLIVEDEVINHFLYEEFFAENEFEILFALNGKEALEIFQANIDKIDIILMDMEMPIMNGYEATREIRKINTKIPIIAQTAHAHREDLDKAILAGCNSFILKPIIEQDLIKKVITFLNIN